MINYYEYLELDMNASVDELNHAIQKVSERGDADLKLIREMKSILLNDEARVLYNNKLISFIVGDRKKSDLVSAESIRKLLNIDNSSLHDKYIWIATGLFVVGVLSACLFSLAVNYTVNLFVMIAWLFCSIWTGSYWINMVRQVFQNGGFFFRQFILLNVVKPLVRGKCCCWSGLNMDCIWHREICVQR